jgi:uncharacterized protein YlbG (UPF0298 family)
MKVILDIEDKKAPALMEILKELKFVKATTITPAKSQLLSEFKEAVDEINQIKAGTKKARNTEDVLAEL